LITKFDKFYKIEINGDYVSLDLNFDNKEPEKQRNNEISTLFESTFVENLSGKGIIDIVNGSSHVMVRTYDQKVYCFRNNRYGQLGTELKRTKILNHN
jgi:alpha-tubulin suppressor-like RCC1 family protein